MKKLGVSRRALYEQVDRPALRSLPTARYVLAHWKLCRANIDYHVERAPRRVPFQLVREQVEVRYTTHGRDLLSRQATASHRRRYDGQPSTHREHMPSAHRAHAEWTPSRLIRWAEQAGPATGQLVAQIIERRPHPEQGYRACLGIMRLGQQYGNDRLDAASARAMALGSYRAPSRTFSPPARTVCGTGGRDNPDAHAHQHPRRRLLRRGHDRGGGPMLIEQTVDKLNAMKLGAMADAVQQQLQSGEAATLGFEERFGLLVDAEWTAREQRKLQRRLQTAKLRHPATLEAVDFTPARRLNRQQVLTLGTCAWLAERHNLIVTGPCGIGKSFLCCAFVERACRRGFTARYVRMPRLLHEVAVGRGDGSYTRLMARLAKLDLLAIDDWMLAPLRDAERRDLTEVIEDRAERASTLIASQLPVTDWHAVIGDPNQADAICDRLLHDAHRIELKGRSMRRTHDAPNNRPKETT